MVDCKRVEEWIPLYVEGDLGESQAADLLAHAQACERCRGLVAEHESSQAWLRAAAAPEFDDAFVDTVRAGVMREITASRLRRPFVERLRDWIAPRRVALAAALALIFIALASYLYLSRSRRGHQEAVIAQQTPASPIEKEFESTPALPYREKITPQPKQAKPHRAAPALASRTRHDSPRMISPPNRMLAQTQPAAVPVAPIDSSNPATQTEERLRIEIQTADPSIRIIWFAPKPAETDAP